MKWKVRQRGSLLIMTLVFVTMFATIFISLSGMVSRTYHESVNQSKDELAFQVAESGLNYARWRLAHNPDDLASETKTITDQFAGDLGTYKVEFEKVTDGTGTVLVTSTGETSVRPQKKVVLEARYGKPSLARFAAITNSNVWYGGTIKGAVHANGGIRMDGSSDSLMTSAAKEYWCMPQHGCRYPFERKPGIWGSGEKKELWEFPVTPINYNAIALDLLTIKEKAIASNTYYGRSHSRGYQIEFNADNTYSIYKVTRLQGRVWSIGPGERWYHRRSHDVRRKTLIETKAVPSNGAIYVEDRVWIKGEIRDRVTVAAGRFPDTTATNVDIILNGNITYGGVHDGSRAFAAIAQRHVMIPYSSVPDFMQLDGAYVAQKGSFHRRYYTWGGHRLKSSLSRYGMIASNEVPVTAWVNSYGQVVSGFQQGVSEYDSSFFYSPPPLFPASEHLDFISWEEKQ